MNTYNNDTHGTQRWVPIMAMPNGTIIFMGTEMDNFAPYWPAETGDRQHPHPEEQKPLARGQANAK